MLQRNCCANEYDPGLWSLKLYCNAEIEQSDLCYENTFGIVCPAGSICDASSLNSNDNTTCLDCFYCHSVTVAKEDDDYTIDNDNSLKCLVDPYCETGESVE